MKSIWIAVVFAFTAGSSCKKQATEAKPESTPGIKSAPTKPLPGTESVRKLLDGVATSAKPNSATQLAIGDLFGKGGVLGGGRSQGAGVVGASKPVATDDRSTDDTDKNAKPATPVTLPSAAPAGGDCAAVAKRIAEIMTAMGLAELGNDDEARKIGEPMVRDLAAAMQPQIEKACTQQSWPRELSDCILTATEPTALQGCERFVTPAMKTAQVNAAPAIARPTTPAPA